VSPRIVVAPDASTDGKNFFCIVPAGIVSEPGFFQSRQCSFVQKPSGSSSTQPARAPAPLSRLSGPKASCAQAAETSESMPAVWRRAVEP